MNGGSGVSDHRVWGSDSCGGGSVSDHRVWGSDS